MNTLRQEFCDETNNPMGLDNEFDYIRWLEAKIQAFRQPPVVGRSEQFICPDCNKNTEEWPEGICKHCILKEFTAGE